MGLRDDEPDDLRAAPPHRVRLTEPFWIGRTEVTQDQWRAVMGSNPAAFGDCGGTCPVESVSWTSVQAFLRRLEGLSPGERYRLPTEAEWEYVCRAGSELRYGGVDTLDATRANIDPTIPFETPDSSPFVGRPVPVGTYAAIPLGLHDVHGNVWEWTEDEYCPYGGDATDPRGRCGSDTVVIRGGSWAFSRNAARCGRRYVHHRDDRGYSLGFRVVRISEEDGS